MMFFPGGFIIRANSGNLLLKEASRGRLTGDGNDKTILAKSLYLHLTRIVRMVVAERPRLILTVSRIVCVLAQGLRTTPRGFLSAEVIPLPKSHS